MCLSVLVLGETQGETACSVSAGEDIFQVTVAFAVDVGVFALVEACGGKGGEICRGDGFLAGVVKEGHGLERAADFAVLHILNVSVEFGEVGEERVVLDECRPGLGIRYYFLDFGGFLAAAAQRQRCDA